MITSVSEVSYSPEDFQFLELEECAEGDFESELGDLLLASAPPQVQDVPLLEPPTSNTSGWESTDSETFVLRSESRGFICENIPAEESAPTPLVPAFEEAAPESFQQCAIPEDMLPAARVQTIPTYVQPQYKVVAEATLENLVVQPAVQPGAQEAEDMQVLQQSILPEPADKNFSSDIKRPFDVISMSDLQPGQSQQPLDVMPPKESIPVQLKGAPDPIGGVGDIPDKNVNAAENLSTMWLGVDKKARFTMNTENLGVIDGQIKQAENRITLAIQGPEASVDVLKSHRDVFRVLVENSFGNGEPHRADVDISSQGEKGSSFDSPKWSQKYDHESSSMWKEEGTVTTPLPPSVTSSLIDTYA